MRPRALVPVLLALLVALGGLAAAPAQAATTATVTGVVTAGGVPMASAQVTSSLPAGTSGSWPQTSTDASGRYKLTVDAATAGSSLVLDVRSNGTDAHAVSVELPYKVAAGATLTKNVALSRLDARLVATIAGIPSGTDPSSVTLWAGHDDTQLSGVASYTAGRPTEIDGLGSGRYHLDVSYGSDNEAVYYPGTRSYGGATSLTLKAGCTTSLSVNLTAGTMKVAGRDCSRLPACASAKTAAATTAATLKHDKKRLKKAKKKLKKSHGHAHAKAAKKVKKLKKKTKRAKRANKRTVTAAHVACS